MNRSLLLLGAGASREVGIPTSYDLTNALIERARSSARHHQSALQAVEFVHSAMLHDQLRRRIETPYSAVSETQVDVEALLRSIDLLGRRLDLEVSPFVRSWDPTVQYLDESSAMPTRLRALWGGLVRALGDVLKNAIQESGRGGGYRASNDPVALTANAASRLSSNGVESHHFTEPMAAVLRGNTQPGDGATFREARRLLEKALISTVWLPPETDTTYLQTLLSNARKDGPLTVATLNYDNSIELATRKTGLRVAELAHQYETGSFPPNAAPLSDILLLKLHGSASWKASASGVDILSDDQVVKAMHAPAIIFGQENKLTAGFPFFDLFLKFRDSLLRSERLVVIGYSWRDEHVNTVVRQFLGGNTTTTIDIVDPGWDPNGPIANQLARLAPGRITAHRNVASEAAGNIAFH